MSKKPPIDDAHLWEHVTKEITPLKSKQKAPEKKQSSQSTSTKKEEIVLPPPPAEHESRAQQALESGGIKDIDRATAQKLKSGKFPIDIRLDLHGHTQEEAFTLLKQRLALAYETGQRCMLVITGKGKFSGGEGVLRQQFPLWLNMQGLREYVVMFTKAMPKDGGSGAFYVLVKRKR